MIGIYSLPCTVLVEMIHTTDRLAWSRRSQLVSLAYRLETRENC